MCVQVVTEVRVGIRSSGIRKLWAAGSVLGWNPASLQEELTLRPPYLVACPLVGIQRSKTNLQGRRSLPNTLGDLKVFVTSDPGSLVPSSGLRGYPHKGGNTQNIYTHPIHSLYSESCDYRWTRPSQFICGWHQSKLSKQHLSRWAISPLPSPIQEILNVNSVLLNGKTYSWSNNYKSNYTFIMSCPCFSIKI